MKNMKFWAIALLFIGLNWACTEEEKSKKTADVVADDKDETCLYDYNNAKSSIKWEAYKTTAKVAVGGTFDQIVLKTRNRNTETIGKLLEDAQFKVMTNSINSDNEERDKKISDFFFGNFDDGQVLTGSINNITGSNTEGAMSITLVMNRKTQIVPFNFTVDEDNILSGEFEIDLFNWATEPAINSLNEKCKDLHTGEDGESKLWSTVKISLSTQLVVDCR